MSALPPPSEKRASVQRMFDRIAPRYDVMNRLLTGGLDQSWRRRALAAAGVGAGDRLLDLACGTGDLSELAVKRGATVIGADFAREMLRGARRRGIAAAFVQGDAEALPLPDASVDDVLCSLVLCTVDDQEAVLAEVRRILRPGGRLRVVEHVAAPRWSLRRWLQHVIRRPWRWLFEGCDTCRDTASAIERAGFATVELHRGHWRHSIFLPVNTSIHAIAVN